MTPVVPSLSGDTKGQGACKEGWVEALPQHKAFRPFQPVLNGAQHRAPSAEPEQAKAVKRSDIHLLAKFRFNPMLGGYCETAQVTTTASVSLKERLKVKVTQRSV